MYISEKYLEEMLPMNSLKEFYSFYPKANYEKHFDGITELYNNGEYLLLAKTLGVMFEPTLNYTVRYGKERPVFLRQLVKDETSDKLLAHFAVAMILDTQEDCLIVHGDTQVVENLNYFEFHELDDRENVKAYHEFVELPYKVEDESSRIEKVLWQWADKFNISKEAFPRDIEGLWGLTELEIVSQGLVTPLGDVSDLVEVLEEEQEDFYLPVEFFELTNLSKLEIFGMNLTYLPDEIEKLTNLAELKLTMNQLEMIPSTVGSLKNLTTLDLSINRLEEIPITLAKLKNLKYLNVSSDLLTITSSQEEWLYEVANDGCEVIWDKDNTTVIGSEDEYDEEQGTRDLIEMLGGEESLMDALRGLK